MKNKPSKPLKLSFLKKIKINLPAEKKSEMLRTSLLFAGSLFVCALVLSGISNLISPLAKSRAEGKVISAMERLVPAEKYEDIAITFDEALGVFSAKKAFKGEETLGYCIETKVRGYKGEIHMVVGTDTSGAVTGVEILSIKETPGYGDRISDDDFLASFKGKNSELTLVRKKTDKENEITAVSGATVSSNAVKEGVNHSIAVVTQIRAAEKKKAEEEEAARKAQEEAIRAEQEALMAEDAARSEDTALPKTEKGGE